MKPAAKRKATRRAPTKRAKPARRTSAAKSVRAAPKSARAAPAKSVKTASSSSAKRTKVVGHTNFEFRAEMLNAFNHANFTPVSGIGGTTLSSYQITALSGTNTSRTVQLVFRFNW